MLIAVLLSEQTQELPENQGEKGGGGGVVLS